MDLSKLSNEDLIALHSKQYSKLSDEGVKYLHAQNNPSPSGLSQNGHATGGQDFTTSPTEKPNAGQGLVTRAQLMNAVHQPLDPLTQKIMNSIYAGGVGESVGAFGQMLNKLIGRGAEAVGNMSKRAVLTDMMKGDPKAERLDMFVKNEIDKAGDQFKGTTNRLKAERLAGLQGKEVSVDPLQFDTQEFANNPNATVPGPQAYDKLNEINANTKFLNRGAHADPAVAQASTESYEAGNQLRGQMAEASDTDRMLGAKQNEAYDLDRSIQRPAETNPIASLRNLKPGTDKFARISAYDNAAGSDLKGLGRNLDTVANRLNGTGGAVPSWVPKAKYANTLLNYIPRAADASAQVVNPAVQSMARGATSALNSAPGTLGAMGLEQYIGQRNQGGGSQ